MKKTIIKYAWAALLPFVASCSDEWDEHYGQGNPMASEESLWQALQERPELSKIARLVEMWDMNIISAVTGCLPFSLPLTTISRRQLWTA